MDNQSHDEYTVGEFKDDQFQGHNHKMPASSRTVDLGTTYCQSSNFVGDVLFAWPNEYLSDGHGTPRYGNTTHGKQIGVKYIIKVL